MHLFSDEALWAAASPSLSSIEQNRLHELDQIAGATKLDKNQETEQEKLVNAYNYSILRRAKALAILAQRGHDVESATPSP